MATRKIATLHCGYIDINSVAAITIKGPTEFQIIFKSGAAHAFTHETEADMRQQFDLIASVFNQ